MENTGKMLRRIRIEGKMSQTDLSLNTGIPRSIIGSVERGQMLLLSDHAARIAKVLGVSGVELLGLDDGSPSEEVNENELADAVQKFCKAKERLKNLVSAL